MHSLAVSAYSTVTAAGAGTDQLLAALRGRVSALRKNDFEAAPLDTWIGRVEGLEDVVLPQALRDFDCRNQRLAWLGLQAESFGQAVAGVREKYGPDRIGVVMGTSTSGILETELGYRRRDAHGKLPDDVNFRTQQNLFSLTDFIQRALALSGPAVTISTACSSSAKAFATASRWIEAGLCRAVVVGGVDTLCLTTLYGFNSLELLSSQPCRPFDAERAGISIGEAAGFVLLEAGHVDSEIRFSGYGESSDAYHMSTPHPEGRGAYQAMDAALQRAGIEPRDIDYINFHGTGTQSNDRAEDRAVAGLFGTGTPGSSTKGWMGHTLGAAGATEAIVSILSLKAQFIPGTLNLERPDPALQGCIAEANVETTVRHVMSNSFGFGGNNCSLVFSRI